MTEKEDQELDERIRIMTMDRMTEDLQLEGFILLGWNYGHFKADKPTKQGWYRQIGKCAYLSKSGHLWAYIFEFHHAYLPHPDPRWENHRNTCVAEKEEKLRVSLGKLLQWFSIPKPEPYGCMPYKNVWIPTVPLWLLTRDKDMRPLYLAGGKPEGIGGKV
jgi:hypothetical protein